MAGRTVALFPGAFRPPHINHWETVRQLRARPDIDEVVVIVSDRLRAIPGTADVLDAEVSLAVWRLYLRGLDRVRVERARSSAVARAAELVGEARPGDRVLLVFGAPDLAAGRTRFGKILRAPPEGVTVEVAQGAPNPRPVRATELRSLLAGDDRGFPAFRRALPAHIGPWGQRRVWIACRQAMTDRHSLIGRQLEATLRANGLEPVDRPRPVGLEAKPDTVYRVELAGRGPAFVKQAGDTSTAAAAAGTGDPPQTVARKSRHRLKVERRALQWLHGTAPPGVLLPRVLCHDRAARTLVLGAVCDDGRRYGDELRTGRADPGPARAALAFLGRIHAGAAPSGPFGDDAEADRHRWRAALQARIDGVDPGGDPQLAGAIAGLARAAAAGTRPVLCHLDLTADNIRCGGGQVGIVDFERSTSIGDPAFDLGTLLGHQLVLTAGWADSGRRRALLEAGIDAYEAAGGPWDRLAARAAGLAGATMAHLDPGHDPGPGRPPAGRVGAPGWAGAAARQLILVDPAATGPRVRAELLGIAARPSVPVGRPGPAPPPTMRRRSLRSVEPCELWEGALVAGGDRSETTVLVEGGPPGATLDVTVDDRWVAGLRLDGNGAGAVLVGTPPTVGKVEVLASSRAVLAGRSFHR